MAEEIKTTKTVIITLDASGFIKNTRAAKGEAELLNKQLEIVESTLEQFQKIAAKSDDQRLVGAFNRLAQSASFLKTAINEAGDADALKALNPQIDVLARRFASFEVQLQRVSQAMADRSVIDILVKEFDKLIDVIKTVISTVNDAPKSFVNFVNSITSALDTFNLFTKNLGFIEAGIRELVAYMDANGGHIMDTLIQGFKEGRLTDIVREVFGDLATIAKNFFDGFLPPGALDDTYKFWARWGNTVLDAVDSTFAKVKSYIGTAFDFIVDSFKGDTLVDKIKNTFSEVTNLAKDFATNTEGSITLFGGGNTNIWDSFVTSAQSAFEKVKGYVKEVADYLGNLKGNDIWDGIVSSAKSAFERIKTYVLDLGESLGFIKKDSNLWDSFADGAKSALDKIKGYFKDEQGSIFNWGDDPSMWDKLVDGAKAAFEKIKSWALTAFENINSSINTFFGTSDWFASAIERAKSGLRSFGEFLREIFTKANDFIKSTLGNREWMVDFLQNAKTGFANVLTTIRETLTAVKSFITSVFSGTLFTDFVNGVKTTFAQVKDTIKFAFETVFPAVKNATLELNNFITNSKSLSGVVDIIGQMVERFGALGLVFKLVAIAIIDQIQQINDKAIQFFKDLGEGARNSVKAFITLSASIEAGLGAGQVEEFSKTISDVGKQFALTSDDVTKATQNIVLFGNEIGLTSEQMQQLINASAVYARSSGKDVASTATALVQALSGNVRALRDYSIVIKDATLQQQGFLKQGQKFSDLDQASQKVLIFNKIMAGVPSNTKIAEAALNSVVGTADRLAVTLKEVENQLGIGALRFTNSSAVAGILNTILENLNDNFLQMVGYIGAVSTKVLGMVLSFTKWFLILGAVQGTLVSVSKLLQSTNWFVKLAFDTNIPLVGQSLRELITRLTGGQVVIKTFGDSVNVMLQVLKNMAVSLSAAIFRVNIFKLSLLDASKVIITSFISAVSKAISVVAEFTLALLRNPLVAAIVGITAVFYALYKALSFIEEQTKVFSTLWGALGGALSEVAGPIEFITDAFVKLYNFLKDTLFQFLGYLLAKFTVVIKGIFNLISILPGLSDNTKKAFADAAKTLDDFGEKLKQNDYDPRKFGPTPEQLKQQEESTKRLAALAAKAAAAIKDMQDKTLKARLAMVDIGVTAEKTKLEEAFKKGEISFGRFTASIEQADLGGKLRKQLLVLEDLKIKGDILPADFENKLKIINSQLQTLALTARENDLKKQFEEGKIGLTEFNDELRKVEESKAYVAIDKLQASLNAGKISQNEFANGLANAQTKLVELSAAGERNQLKESFNQAKISLEELQDGMTKIELNKQLKLDLIDLQERFAKGLLNPEQFAQDAEKIKVKMTELSVHQQKLEKQRADEEALRRAKLQYGAGSIGVAQEKRKQEQERIKEQQKGLGENDIAGNFISGIKEAAAAIPTLGESLQEVGKTAFKGLEDSLVSFVQTGKLSFADLGKTISEMLIRIGIQKALVAAIELFGKGGVFVNGQATAFANGAAFANGHIKKFAQGGIVKTPTIFPMANGMGLMGEKGPEGVLPLSRNNQGRLGVNAEGMGGNTTVVNVYNQTKDSEVETKESTDSSGAKKIEVFITQKIKAAFQSGEMDRTMQNNFGLSRSGSR